MRIANGSLKTGQSAAVSAGLISSDPDNHMTTNRKMIVPCLLVALRHFRSGRIRSVVALIAEGFCLVLLTAGFGSRQLLAANDAAHMSNPSRPMSVSQGAAEPSTIMIEPVAAYQPKRADFDGKQASPEARHVADWVVASGDNQSMPFVIVDKINAKVFVFHADGRLRSAAPALLGLARGDTAVPGIGNRALSSIRPEERTTPAGRFVASLGRNFHGKEILWVDYEGAVSMHPVVTSKPSERRAERLATPTPLDNRISFGCINVPAKFFKTVVRPAFNRTKGVVYVLPETRSAREVFGSYDVDEHERQQPAPLPTSPRLGKER